MIRRMYVDLALRRWRDGGWGWALSLPARYLAVRAGKALGRPVCGPLLGTLVTNYSCNYRCVMCDLPSAGEQLRSWGHAALTTAGMKEVLRGFRALGTLGIGFTGGEPLLRPDVFDLLSYTKELGMVTHLNTNGALLDRAAAREVVQRGVESVNVSLDGASPATHDAVRGVAGAHEGAVEAVRRVLEARAGSKRPVRLKVVATLGPENIGEAGALVDQAAALGVDCVEFIARQPFRAGAREEGQGFDDAFLAAAERAVSELLRRKRAGAPIENSPRMLRTFRTAFRGAPSPVRCSAGLTSLVVDCYGLVYPCLPWTNWRRPSTSLAEGGVEGAWRSSAHGEARRETARCRDCTLNCHAELNLLFDWGRVE